MHLPQIHVVDKLHPVSRVNAQSEATDDWRFVNPLDCVILCMNRVSYQWLSKYVGIGKNIRTVHEDIDA